MPEPKPINAACPRCGYDLNGQRDAWIDRCPLEATCPECGMAFRWAEVISGKGRVLTWFVGLAPAFGLRCIFGTLFRSFTPWWFWHKIRLTDDIRRGRLLADMLIALVTFHLIAVLIGGTSAYAYEYIFGGFGRVGWARVRTPPDVDVLLHAVVWPYNRSEANRYFLKTYGFQTSTVHGMAMTFGALMLMAYILLGETFSGVKQRRRHAVRIAAYALPPSLAFIAFAAIGQFASEMLRWAKVGPQTFIRTAANTLADATQPVCAVTIVFIAAFWYFGMSRYIQIDRPRTTWLGCISLAIAGTLLIHGAIWMNAGIPRDIQPYWPHVDRFIYLWIERPLNL